MKFASLFFLALLSLTACQSLAPWSDNTSIELPKAYVADEEPSLEVKQSLLQLFSNKELREVVESALTNNPDLLASRARLEELGFNLRKTKGALFPSLSVNSSSSRSKSIAVPRTTSHNVSLDARWEVDVWGRIRSNVAAVSADRASALSDHQSASQSLAAQVMQAWFQLVSAEKSLGLSQRRVDSFESTAQLVQRRFELGQASLGQLKLAKTDVENSRADFEASRNQRDMASRQVRVLMGGYPDESLSTTSWPSLENTVAAGLPSDLLRKRPDIVAAYQDIRAADARVQVAHADLFPSFTLTASGGRQTNTLSDLANSNFNYWNLIGNLSAPIFEAGQRRAELGAAGKRAEQAYRRYQSVVLNALREVEDALGSEQYLAREESARLAAFREAQAAFDRTRRDYEAGITDLLSLLETQRGVFNTEQQTIKLRASRLNNRVALALALGKGA
ncbi:MAG: efflux transporter outer membrane subunit [Verrucomicrobiales bacterium]|jgi:multidrug efflux system outer membrane protein